MYLKKIGDTPQTLNFCFKKHWTRLNNDWDAETPRESLPQRVPRHFVRRPARYDLWGRGRFSTLKHNIQDKRIWLLTLSGGGHAPKNGQNPPYESFLKSRGFRPEIQGLRAFAVLLVVVYHVWAGKVSGGVDFFLFISTFLLSLSFMRKINEGKLTNNYRIHVFTRLLPAASVVILLTLAVSLLVLSPTAWSARAVDAQSFPGEQGGGGRYETE